ncbi:MAG: heat-inducible transcriptional repressor HrcA [Bacillota bacterium]
MDLDERKLQILQAIIDDYILTAAPIGSRTISKRTDIGLSSATIRNEMSDLEELGFLEQPHTSAGRIPSDKAYRLYVNNIMKKTKLTPDECSAISKLFSRRVDAVEDVIRQTAWVLSNVTHYTSMVLAPQLKSVKLKHIQLVPISERKALVVIVTNTGITRDSIVHIPADMDAYHLERLSRMLTAHFANMRLEEASRSMEHFFSEEVNSYRGLLKSMSEVLNQRISGSQARSVELSGATNMLNYPEYSDLDKARAFLSAIETKDYLFNMLANASKLEFTVTIGSENESMDMKDCSVVTATYKIGEDPIGSMGVIGPTRMNYAKVLAILGFMGNSLSEMLTNLIEEEKR